jgi:hypothetical protein
MRMRTQKPKLHLITNPKQPDVLLGASDDSEPEAAPSVSLDMFNSYLAHPSHAESPSIS